LPGPGGDPGFGVRPNNRRNLRSERVLRRSQPSKRAPSTTAKSTTANQVLDVLGLGPNGMNYILPGTHIMTQSLGGAAVVNFGLQLVGWAFASALKTEKFYDLFGSLAFASTAAMTFASSSHHPRQTMVTSMVCAWTIRLGVFLVRRVLRDGGDSRFDEVKHDPATYFVYWMMQGAWVFVTALPCYLINGVASQRALHAGDYVSLIVWFLGIATETVADVQKQIFKRDPANRGRFIDSGLWSLSRHPNYFGEIVTWWGVCGVALSMNATQATSACSLLSPIFVTLLITKVSGVPLLEKSADERWGSEAGYQAYKRNTPCLIPKLPGTGNRAD
jgi:steroid 5-alpha reductase family enzyme